MFDEREIEELCDEFLSLDGNMFLGSLEDMTKLGDGIVSTDLNNKTLLNLNNNNFICYSSGVDLDKPDPKGTHLDVVNENSINLNTFERFKNPESAANSSELGKGLENPIRSTVFLDKKENENDNEFKEVDEKLTSPDAPVGRNYFHRNGWAPDTVGLWRSGPSSLNLDQTCNNYALNQDLTSSATYISNEQQSLNTFLSSPKRIYSHQQLGAKVEMVYSLLSMLDMNNREDMSKTFLAMSSSSESCHAMRQSGCLPLLIQLIHSSELNREVRERAAEALQNIVYSQTDEKRRKREVRVLKLLQQVREYCDDLKNNHPQELLQLQAPEKHPINAIGTLMKFSFDAEHRQAICILGGLHAISELIQVDYETHGNTTTESPCITLRRYAGMSLTNLTFGDCKNKALLCSFNKFMYALVDQLKSPCEDLRQVTASVIRNLSWRADSESKQALRDVGAVTALTISAMEGKKESTLKSILSALWNLSAHCSLNKVDICSVPGALAFLVKMLKYKSSSNTLAIVENAGGILRNVSSHVAVREDYRQILRENNCFEVLLEQLKSPSLTIVSNACGTLWNLSARCTEDQRRLWEMGATSMLRSLVQSKHKMISMGSSAALKNLLAANPNESLLTHLDSTAKSLGLQNLPTLFVRKKRALEQELNITLAETCENIESIESPTYFNSKTETKKECSPRRSESRDSVQSTQSDSTYERINQICLKNEEKLLENKNVTLHDSLDEKSLPRKLEDQKLIRRYKTSMIPTPTYKKVNQDRINERTREGEAQEIIANEIVTKYNFKEDGKSDSNFTHENGFSSVYIEPKSSVIPNDTQSSSNNFKHQECVVKYNKSESFEVEDVENAEKHNTSPVLNSLPYQNPPVSDLNHERNAKPNSTVEDGITKDRKCEKIKKDREEHENCGISNSCTSETCLPSALNIERNCSSGGNSYVLQELDEKVNESASKREMTKCGSFEQLPKNDSLKSFVDRHKITHCIKSIATKDSDSNVCKNVLFRSGEQSSARELQLKVDFLPNVYVSGDSCQSTREMLPPINSVIPNSGESSVMNPKEHTHIESKKNMKMDEKWCLMNKGRTLNRGQDEFFETPHKTKIPDEEKRYETSEGASRGLLVKSLNLSNQSSPQSISSLNLDDRDSLVQRVAYGVADSPQVQADSNKMIKIMDVTKAQPTEISFPSDPGEFVSESTHDEADLPEKLDLENIDCDHLKTLNNVVLPKFKVGSPITDSKALHLEANKICREIRKHQDFEMGCSLTSEMSLVSCSSFIDTGDYSLFDSSSEAADFDDTENLDVGKMPHKLKYLPLRKPTTSQTAEFVSLPSLGSLKNEQIEALDLDSSILSVASITSEVAETYSDDLEAFRTYTKTYKINAQNEPPEDTVADATLVSNGDDTLNADSLQNNPELFDDDNSLHSQENLPLDSEDFEESASDRMKKKLTPKEKRKTFHERYKTYTIRDYNGCKSSEMASASSCQGPKYNVNKGEVSVSSTHYGNHELVQNNSFRNINDEVRNGKQEFQSSSRSFCVNRIHEPFLNSMELADAQNLIPGFAVHPTTVNELMNIGPAKRKELVDNAKLVAFSLKTAVQDYEMTSDSETEDPRIDFDTATYSKHFRDQRLEKSGPQELQYLNHYEISVEEDLEKKGARIFKPNMNSDEKPEEPPKGIRGRRKPLYSSPQKHLLRSNGSPSSPKAVVDAKKSMPEMYTPAKLHREGTFTKDDGSALKKNDIKNHRTIPALYKNGESKNLSSARPASGNKPGNPKRNGDTQVSKIGRPLSTYTNKVNERRPESDSSQRRIFSAETENATEGDGAQTKKSTCSGLSPKMRSSSSNQNVKPGNIHGSGFVKSKNQTPQNSKSQSDAGLNFVVCKDRGKPKTPKKEVTSKIASLWKKVEESKQKNKILKDNRVWISSEKNTGIGDEVLVVEQEEILDIPTRRIVHSLTCQALSDAVPSENTSQERNSRTLKKFAHFGGSKEKYEKIERRNIMSAVLSPYNYNPLVSEITTSSEN